MWIWQQANAAAIILILKTWHILTHFNFFAK